MIGFQECANTDLRKVKTFTQFCARVQAADQVQIIWLQLAWQKNCGSPQKSLKLENRDKKVYSNNGDEYVDNSRRI